MVAFPCDGIDAPAIMATYSDEDKAYWSSDERMGGKDKYKKICAQDEGKLPP